MIIVTKYLLRKTRSHLRHMLHTLRDLLTLIVYFDANLLGISSRRTKEQFIRLTLNLHFAKYYFYTLTKPLTSHALAAISIAFHKKASRSHLHLKKLAFSA